MLLITFPWYISNQRMNVQTKIGSFTFVQQDHFKQEKYAKRKLVDLYEDRNLLSRKKFKSLYHKMKRN
jgi:hypothetical protein